MRETISLLDRLRDYQLEFNKKWMELDRKALTEKQDEAMSLYLAEKQEVEILRDKERRIENFRAGLKSLILANEIGFINRDLLEDGQIIQTELFLTVDESPWETMTFHDLLSEILYEIEDEQGHTEVN